MEDLSAEVLDAMETDSSDMEQISRQLKESIMLSEPRQSPPQEKPMLTTAPCFQRTVIPFSTSHVNAPLDVASIKLTEGPTFGRPSTSTAAGLNPKSDVRRPSTMQTTIFKSFKVCKQNSTSMVKKNSFVNSIRTTSHSQQSEPCHSITLKSVRSSPPQSHSARTSSIQPYGLRRTQSEVTANNSADIETDSVDQFFLQQQTNVVVIQGQLPRDLFKTPFVNRRRVPTGFEDTLKPRSKFSFQNRKASPRVVSSQNAEDGSPETRRLCLSTKLERSTWLLKALSPIIHFCNCRIIWDGGLCNIFGDIFASGN
ncbi:hypothetical protein BC829DRAFT_19992 [Chytridium lagenaria]|nr:hypothetical protein BC829DRAFT_19992 [Chytridium lagenaria]